MKILLNNSDLNKALNGVSNLGYVPTMGSLHKGHISLIKRSLTECNKTIVSIFINPTQFNNQKDYKNYPRNVEKDLIILKRLKIDFLYLPNKKDIYKKKRKFKIKIDKIDKILCAKYRIGHFEGVIEVMDRLTKIINPNKIFMGEKDYQQLFLIKKYIRRRIKSLVFSCKTIRDKNKLALSSRNLLLSKTELIKGGKIAKNILSFKKKLKNIKKIRNILEIKKKKLIKQYGITIEYLELRNKINLRNSNEIKNSKIFIAYYLNKIRIIDNF
jgi:pantoate--beta-alanine ligase